MDSKRQEMPHIPLVPILSRHQWARLLSKGFGEVLRCIARFDWEIIKRFVRECSSLTIVSLRFVFVPVHENDA